MTKLWNFVSWGSASLAAALLVTALAATPTQADDPPQNIPPQNLPLLPPPKIDSCTASLTQNPVLGVSFCTFGGQCVLLGVNIGCTNTTVKDSTGSVVDCTTAC